MHVVRDRAHVVEELRVDRPLLVFLPDRFADERAAAFGDGLLEREAVLADDDVAEAFVGRAVFVGGGRGGGEPAFVDAAAVQAVGVEVVGVELEPLAGLEEGARHPAGREAEQAAGGGDFGLDEFGTFFLIVFRAANVSMAQGKEKI